MNIDKIILMLPAVLLLLLFTATVVIEMSGCQIYNIFNTDFGSIFTPGIKVIG
jgi:hypothetical protein